MDLISFPMVCIYRCGEVCKYLICCHMVCILVVVCKCLISSLMVYICRCDVVCKYLICSYMVCICRCGL